MIIGIDASRALRTQRTGTEHYALQIVRHLLNQEGAIGQRWRLYIDRRPVGMPLKKLFALEAGSTPVGPVEMKGVPPVDVRRLLARRFWTHRALAREVLQHPPDVLFVPAHVLPLVLPPRRLPPSVVTVHDLGHRYYPAAHTRFQRMYLELSTRWSVFAARQVIAVSRSTAIDLQRFYATPADKIQVIYEAAIPTVPATAEQRQVVTRCYHLARPYALYVGTIQPRKNLARLMAAYAGLLQQHALDWDLVLAGRKGWLSETLYAQAQRLGVAERVHFLGYVPEADLPALLGAARFFAFPSLFEGFGLPVLEAQQIGVPVMCANNSALPEVAGDAALLVDPTDVEAIADAMLRLSRDEALRQRLIAAGYENVKRFSWEKAARETLAVLEMAAKQ